MFALALDELCMYSSHVSCNVVLIFSGPPSGNFGCGSHAEYKYVYHGDPQALIDRVYPFEFIEVGSNVEFVCTDCLEKHATLTKGISKI